MTRSNQIALFNPERQENANEWFSNALDILGINEGAGWPDAFGDALRKLNIVDDLKKIMEDTYKPMNGMALTCGVEHSWVSWGKQDVVEGNPVGIRSDIQEESHAEA